MVRVLPDVTAAEPTVLVVDNQPLFARTLAFALQILVVSSHWTADTPLNALHLAEQLRRDDVSVVVLGLPVAEDFICRPLIEACGAAQARVLIVTESYDDELEAGALLAGAVAVFDKARPFDDLARDLFEMIMDDTTHRELRPRDLAAHVTEHVPRASARRGALESLSPRENEVLRCLVDGKTVDEIAAGAALSVATVRSHVHAILTKLGVNCQVAAVATARRGGWSADWRLRSSQPIDQAG